MTSHFLWVRVFLRWLWTGRFVSYKNKRKPQLMNVTERKRLQKRAHVSPAKSETAGKQISRMFTVTDVFPRNCAHSYPKMGFPLYSCSSHSNLLLPIYIWPQTASSVWAVTGLIGGGHFILDFHASVFPPPAQDTLSTPSHVKTLCFFFVVDVGDGSSLYPSASVKHSRSALDEKIGVI